MKGYCIDLDHNLVESFYSDEEWGEWSETWSNFLGRTARSCDERPDVITDLPFRTGDSAIVVWIEWSSGDSFGHGECKYAEILAIFMDLNVAEEFVLYIQNKTTTCSETYESADGQHIQIPYPGWLGYFDRLNEIHADTVTII